MLLRTGANKAMNDFDRQQLQSDNHTSELHLSRVVSLHVEVAVVVTLALQWPTVLILVILKTGVLEK